MIGIEWTGSKAGLMLAGISLKKRIIFVELTTT